MAPAPLLQIVQDQNLAINSPLSVNPSDQAEARLEAVVAMAAAAAVAAADAVAVKVILNLEDKRSVEIVSGSIFCHRGTEPPRKAIERNYKSPRTSCFAMSSRAFYFASNNLSMALFSTRL